MAADCLPIDPLTTMENSGRLRRWLAAAVAFACQAPGRVLAGLFVLHFLVWTALPILVCRNLQLDLVEGLAFGREWQLGYWKHPPLPWWTVELARQATGDFNTVYMLG